MSPSALRKQTEIYPHSDCLWMQAGVVRKKRCLTDYNCPECHFDRILRRIADRNMKILKDGGSPEGKKGKIIHWKDRMKALPPVKRACVHHMKGRIKFRICTNGYRCESCDFDQLFYDQYSVHAVINPVDLKDIKGFKIPRGYYVHRGHAWARIEEGLRVRVGADDFALRLLGPLDSIEAPLIGKEVQQGEKGINLFRGKNRAGLLSPVSGVVTSINPMLRERGELANDDPYSEGWIMMVEPYRLRYELKNLMLDDETDLFINGQVEKLYQTIEGVSGPLVVDGGTPGNDIYGSMPELGWAKLVKTFLCN